MRDVAATASSADSLAASPKPAAKSAISQTADSAAGLKSWAQAMTTAAAPQAAHSSQSPLANAVAASSVLGGALTGLATVAQAANALSPDVTPIADLASRLQREAASLTPEETQPGRSPVKELELQLEPADLGKVAVKLRLSSGKLAVDIGVANVNALAAVQSQGDQLMQRLQSNGQPLDSFVIRQQSQAEQDLSNGSMQGTFANASSDGGESSNARDRQPRRQPEPSPSLADLVDSASADYMV
jgi:flagellar hook-length control protein FliK